jgi:DNA-binding GntR family transcriptional regulator
MLPCKHHDCCTRWNQIGRSRSIRRSRSESQQEASTTTRGWRNPLQPQPLAGQAGESRATQLAMTMLHEMILRQDLFPGEQIRQEELAERAGISRSPLREALRTLVGEGLLVHVPNRGYFVARMSAKELEEIYLMRGLLERELILSTRTPTSIELEDLTDVNHSLKVEAEERSILGMLNTNRTFHMMIFALSPLTVVTQEVDRLWRISEPYRAAYLSLPETPERVLNEHYEMIEALRSGDRRRLKRITDVHRNAAELRVLDLLPGAVGRR